MPRGNYKDVFEEAEPQEVYTIESLVDGMEGIAQRARTPSKLNIQPSGLLTYKGVTLASTALVLDHSVSEHDMQVIAGILGEMNATMAWWAGDLLLAYERYGDGTKLAQLIGLKPETLWNYKSICKQVEPSRRREGLSFGHHAVVASLSDNEQSYYLGLAEKGEDDKPWSISRLRTEVHGRTIKPKRNPIEGVIQRYEKMPEKRRREFVEDLIEWINGLELD